LTPRRRSSWSAFRDAVSLPSPAELQRGVEDLAGIARQQILRLAVTGLRQGGKTVFVTALVHHLLSGRELPFLSAAQEGRLLGARLLPPRPGDLPAFPFAQARAALAAPEPRWPEPTRSLSALRLELRFAIKGVLRRRLGPHRSLILMVIDYPGEWLLDLPLLEQTYEAWSTATIELSTTAPRAQFAGEWRRYIESLDPGRPATPAEAARAADLYKAYLHRCQREAGLGLLQPGRFTMPSEATDADLLGFCPLPLGPAPRGSLRDLMGRRYDRYCAEVVEPFYRDHFSRFDRQIVLIDLLSTLNRGPACFADLQATLDMVLRSFRYGSSGLIARLFRPRIGTLLFAASKADHVAHNQHNNLRLLLERLVSDAAARARFEGITPTFVALAAHRSTDVVRTEYQGQVLSCVRGRLKDDDRDTVLFPGEIPAELPSEEDWQAGRFRFCDFAPRRLRLNGAGPPQHIRLDQALEILIGDRLR
jgi:predicted YcjX-like family ATPase